MMIHDYFSETFRVQALILYAYTIIDADGLDSESRVSSEARESPKHNKMTHKIGNIGGNNEIVQYI